MNRENALLLVLGLAVGLAVGFGVGVHHGGEAPAPSATTDRLTPAEEIEQWQQVGFSGDAARILVTRSRTGLTPSQLVAEMAATTPGAAPGEGPLQPPSQVRDPRQDCGLLAGGRYESPGAWERALVEAGEPWIGIVRAVGEETDATRRLDGLLAGFQRICPPPAEPAAGR
jgi:hypothetical protein